MKIRIFILSVCALADLSVLAGAHSTEIMVQDGEKGAATKLENLLQGQVSGVRVSSVDGSINTTLNTNIRGINSLRGSSAPLWIVDGVALSTAVGEELNALWQYGDNGYMSTISQMIGFNPYDIESIEVLKNTSATAQYGFKGANGVIIVKTRSAREGNFNLDWNSNVSFNGSASDSGDKVFSTVSHNHNINLSATNGRTNYSISAFYRDNEGLVGDDNQFAGLRVAFGSKANSVVWFGLNSNFSVGNLASKTATAWYGSPSYGLAKRGITALNGYDSSLEGWDVDYDDNLKTFRTFDSANLTFNFTPWLTWKNTIGFDFQTSTRQFWYGNNTGLGLAKNGVAALNYQSLFTFEGKSELNFNVFIGKKNNIKADLAIDVNGDFNKYNNMAGDNFTSHSLRAKGLQLLGSKPVIRKSEKEFVHIGMYGHLAYNFDQIAGVEGLVRFDNNPYFEDGFNIYPSVNAYFDIHKAFMQNLEIISTVRLEGGYGIAGWGRYVPYATYGRYTGGAYVPVSNDMQKYYEGYNKLTSSEFNISLNLGFFNDRFTFDLTHYRKSTEDKLNLWRFGRVINAYSDLWTKCGKTDVSEQSSIIANDGWELDFGARIIDQENISLTVDANVAFNNNRLNKVDRLDEWAPTVDNKYMVTNVNILGQSASSLYGYVIENGSVVCSRDLGETIPKIYGGFGAALRIFCINLDAQFDGAAGFNILNMNRMLATHITDMASSNFVEKGDYLRLSRLTVSYDIPVNVKWIKGLKASLTGTNLFSLTKYSGWNPDVNSFGVNNYLQGIDYGSFPLMRSLIVGLALNF